MTVDAGGNVPPAVAIATRLKAQDVDIQVLGHPRQAASMLALGFGFSAMQSLAFWDSRVPRPLLPALWRAVRLASDREIADETETRLRDLRPDAVLVDSLSAAAAHGARRAGVPSAIHFHTFLAFWRGSYATGPVGLLARLRGADIRAIWNGADRRLVTSDGALDPAGPARTHDAEWVGSTETGVPAAPDAGAPPHILVSLSTTWFPGQTRAYQSILDALATLPVTAIVTTGGIEPDVPLRVPDNVQVAGRVPHAGIMPRASLIIGHGGHSTSFAALAHGLPLLILPMHPMLDQPMMGKVVTNAGAGLSLGRKASPTAIAGAVQRLLAEPSFRNSAGEIGARLRATDGAAVAASRLLDLAMHRRKAA